MNLRRCLHVVLVVMLMAAGAGEPVLAQDEALEVRFERVAAIKPDAARTFFDTLRRNVGQNEHAAACAMIAFPLKHETGAVTDAADCAARYDAIFTIPVRRAIGRQRFEELFVNQSGVMFGLGEVWFAGVCAKTPCQSPAEMPALRITAINGQTDRLLPPKGKALLNCAVSGQRIEVAADGNGGASLNVWYAPSITGAPARVFPRAEPAGAPTACGSRTWVFTDGTRTYTVSELPCDAHLTPPPMGSVGRVSLSTAATPDDELLWCRDLRD